MKKMLMLLIVPLVILSVKVNVVAAINLNSAQSLICMDMDTNRILCEKNKDEVHLTASIAKIMTCIVAIENGDLNKYCVVTKDVISQVGSSIYLELNDEIKLKDLLYGMMLRSGNDAAYLVSISVFDKEQDFIYQMNVLAGKLKMTSSVFNNPSGLDDETKNYSTAYDMALLMTYAMKNQTFKDITSTISYSCKTKNGKSLFFNNKHKLLRSNQYAISGKTGYTKEARRTLVTTFSKDDINIVCVTFDCGNDWELHINISDYIFENYSKVTVFKKGILDIDYTVTLIIYEDVSYSIREDESLDCVLELLTEAGNEKIVGKFKLYLNDELAKTIDVYRYY